MLRCQARFEHTDPALAGEGHFVSAKSTLPVAQHGTARTTQQGLDKSAFLSSESVEKMRDATILAVQTSAD